MSEPTNELFTPDLAAQYQKVLGAHPIFTTRPNIAAALAQANPDQTTLQVVGGFLHSLELAKQVRLTRTGGSKMVLKDQDRAYLDLLGEEYSDVDAAPVIKQAQDASNAAGVLSGAQPAQTAGAAGVEVPESHGFFGKVAGFGKGAAHLVANVADAPGIHQVLTGLDTAADATRGVVRAGEYGISKITPDFLDPMDPGGENDREMRERGYDPNNPVSVIAFFAEGKQNYNKLDDLRDKYGDGAVKAAQAYLEHPETFDVSANFDDDTNVARIQAVNDPHWQEIVKLVDSRHMSLGREIALGLHLDPTKGGAFNKVSGSLDAVETFFVDPTIIGGKVAKTAKYNRLALDSLVDEQGIRRVMANNGSVRRGWQELLDDAHIIRTGTDVEVGAAYAAIRNRSPELMPLVDEINGKVQVVVNKTSKVGGGAIGPERLVSSRLEWTQQAPIEDLDQLTEYLVNKDALVRTLRGHTPKTGVYMPGSVSRFAAAKNDIVAGTAFIAGRAHGNRIIDLSKEAARVLPTPGDAVGGPLAAAEVRGDALAAANKTVRGKFLSLAKRMTTLVPNETKLDFYSPAATDMVYKFAAAAMPKAEARLIAAHFSAADLAGRRTIYKSMQEQVIHSAGLETTATGRELAARMRGDLAKAEDQTYSLAPDADLLVDDAGARRVAVAPGQVSTEMWLPSFREIQQAAAKVGMYDHTMKRVAESAVVDKLMQTVRSMWITTTGGALRNVMDNWVGASASGVGWTAFKGGLASGAQRHAARAMERELPAGVFPGTSEAAYHKARIQRVLSHISTAKASTLKRFTSEEFQEAASILGSEIAQGHISKLGLQPTALVTGLADPHNLEDVAAIAKTGARPSEIAFKQWEQKGWGEVAAHGEAGARNWSHNLDQYVGETPGLGQRLVAAVQNPGPAEPGVQVYRLSRKGDDIGTGTRAQGDYYSLVEHDDFKSPFSDLREIEPSTKFVDLHGVGAKDKVLDVPEVVVSFKRGPGRATEGPVSTGVAAVKAVKGQEEFDRLLGIVNSSKLTEKQKLTQLIDEYHEDYGAHDFGPAIESGDVDAYAVVEAIGAQAARQAGFTALIGRAAQDFSEYVALTPGAVKQYATAAAASQAAGFAVSATDELVSHIAEHPEMATYREFAELGRPIKDAATPELKREAAISVADRMLESFKMLVTDRDGNLIHGLLDRLERGEVPSLEWFGQNIPTKMRPEHVIGRSWAAVPASPELTGLAGVGQTLGQGYTAFLSKSYEVAVAKPIASLSSKPIFLGNFVKARRNLAGYEAKLIEHGLEPEAAKLHSTKLALDHAMDMTSRMIDNPEVASQMATMSRNLINFPRAAEDWVRRWSRIVKEDPTVIRKVQMTVEGGQHSGFIDRDDQGNMIFTYPGSGAVINALLKAGEALHIPKMASIPTVPDLKSNIMFLNPSLNNPFFPGASPLIITPLKVTQGFFPESKLMFQDLQAGLTGDDRGAGQGVMAQFFPSVVKNMFKALTADETDAQMSSAMRNALVHLDAAGLDPDSIAAKEGRAPRAQDREDYLARVRIAARNQLVLRAVFAFALPATPSLPENEASGGNEHSDALFQAQGISTLKDEMRVLVNKLGYERALGIWTKLHPDELAYTVSGTKLDSPYSSVPVTRKAEIWVEDNLDFVRKYPKLAAYFVPDSPGDFSPEAYRAQLELGIRSRKGLEGFYGDIRTVSAERTYYEVRDRRDKEIAKAKAVGDSDGVAKAKAIWTSWTQGDGTTGDPGFLNLNPLFAEKLASYGARTVWREQAIGDLENMLKEGAFGETSGSGGNTVALGKTGNVPVDAGTAQGIASFIAAFRSHDSFTKSMTGRRDKDALQAKDNEQRAYDKYMLGVTGSSYDADGRLTGGNSALRDIYQGLFRGLD